MNEALDEACRAIDRDPSTLARSTMAGVLVGRDQDEVDARERALLKAFGEDMEAGEAWLDERRNRWVYGTPDQARDQLQRFAAAGLERIMLQDFLPWDLDISTSWGRNSSGGPDAGRGLARRRTARARVAGCARRSRT